MEYKDYYEILGISRDASPEDIRAAYRRLARKYHPDVNPSDTTSGERFKEINEAHEVLKDAEKRSKYDRLGADWHRYQNMGGDPSGFDWSQWSASGGPRGGGMHTEYVDLNDILRGSGNRGGFSDFFESVFGGAGPGRGRTGTRGGSPFAPVRGRNIEQPVDVTLEEAHQGTMRVVQIGERRLEIKVPPGVQTGSRVRVAGAGQPGYDGGMAGDLFLVISVRDHPQFKRDGNDLRLTLPVDLYAMILGDQVLVPTMKGRVSLTIPMETKSGQVFRLRGQGMPLLRDPSQYGDLYVEVQPSIPHDLSDEEKALFKELATIRGRVSE